MQHTAARIVNVSLRMTTLGARLLLVFILAKHLDAASLGNYGLFAAAVGYALLFVGFDLYVYVTREITRTESRRQGLLLKSQAALVGILYLLFTPIIITLLLLSGFPRFLLWWFFPILILEHLNQELYRLLIIQSEQMSASLLLFLRQGSWVLIIAWLMGFNDGARNLHAVMLLWMCAGMAAAVGGMWKLRRLRLGGWKDQVDWEWIKKGMVVSGGFLVATLALRGVQTIDRYWLQNLAGSEVVGAYVLFFGVASVLHTFLDAAIFSFRYPEMIALRNREDYKELWRNMRAVTLQVISFSLAFAVLSSLLLPVLLEWINNEVFISLSSLYYITLACSIVYTLSMVPHYGLYALGCDRAIIFSQIGALAAFVAVTHGLAPVMPIYAAPIGVFAAMNVVFIYKAAAYLRAARAIARCSGEPKSRSSAGT